MSGWDRSDPAEWADATKDRPMTARERREIEATFRRIEREGWNPGDADEWAPVPARRAVPARQSAVEAQWDVEPPRIRVWVVVVAFALIVLAGVVGILTTTPGVWNGASILTLVIGAAGIALVVREVRR